VVCGRLRLRRTREIKMEVLRELRPTVIAALLLTESEPGLGDNARHYD
jgi:hypothetical protein